MAKDIIEASLDDLGLEARLENQRAENAELKREKAQLRRRLGQALEVRDMLGNTVKALRAPAKIRPIRKGKKKSPVTMLVLAGDFHAGEVVDPRETDDWGRYNYAIAEHRIATYVRALCKYADVQRHGYTIDDCHVVLLGDMISGDIHEELMRTNEVPPPIQAILAGRLIVSLILPLAETFSRVIVEGVGGSNHGRLSKRYQFKGGTLNNFDWVAYEYAAAVLRGYSTVTVNIRPSKKSVVDIGGFKFLCAHGDHIRAWMGLPYYGLDRDMGREAKRRLEKLMERIRRKELDILGEADGVDYGLGAHFHVPFVGPSFKYLLNGSLTGTTELDHALGRHAPPQQVAAMVSHKHGLFGPVAWRLDTDEERELVGKDAMDWILTERAPDAKPLTS